MLLDTNQEKRSLGALDAAFLQQHLQRPGKVPKNGPNPLCPPYENVISEWPLTSQRVRP